MPEQPAFAQEPERPALAQEPEGSTVAAVLRTARLDPGRRGVLALVLVGLVASVVAGVVLLRGQASEQPLVAPPVAGASPAASGGPLLVIDVAGKVRHPGLVRLPVGSRVDDALRAAGGVLPGASTGSLNLARKLADGEQVVVGEAGAPGATGASAKGAGGLLDLNTATAQDLDALPGIGPVLAERIVSWRTEHGRFASVDQLREVDGIGEAKYSSLKTKVTV
ncbi:MAG: competence protein ComEA helix-hairpin-helix repeat protein [Frankiales bacterium]|nr:competence protein ComEA helix-hairpin-helix repeat protein [Frankiales bacterium]